MARRSKLTQKVCRCCGEEKAIEHFTHKNSRCNQCLAAGNTETNEHYRMQRLVTKLERRVRWKNAKKVTGYKFSGNIPEPKDISYYRFND